MSFCCGCVSSCYTMLIPSLSLSQLDPSPITYTICQEHHLRNLQLTPQNSILSCKKKKFKILIPLVSVTLSQPLRTQRVNTDHNNGLLRNRFSWTFISLLVVRFFLLHFNCSFAKSPLAAVTILTPTHIAAAGALLAAAKVVLPIPYIDQELSQRIKLGHAHCCFIGLSSLLLSLPPWITTLGLEKSFGLVHHVAKIWTIHISVFEKLWARMRPLQSSRSSSS